MPESNPNRSRRKERIGSVVSDKMDKTIVVSVERRMQHPRFKKVITRTKKFYAHDDQGQARLGDQVRIQETRALSKTKAWRLVEVLNRDAAGAAK
jgi:small subunit ribosomal protein S17